MSIISYKLLFHESDEPIEITFSVHEGCTLSIGNLVTYSFYFEGDKLKVDCSETLSDLEAAYRLDYYEQIIVDDYEIGLEFSDDIKCVVCWGINYCIEKGCLKTPCGKVCV